LLYVSEGGANVVATLKVPSYKRASKLGGLQDPAGLCANSAGDVWVVNSKSFKVVEYAHGSKKHIGLLADSAALEPYACSVDPTTGNLAVTTIGGAKGGGGGVLVYASAKGTPSVYTSSNLAVAYFCAYDASGDLFVDGLDSNYKTLLLELPFGATQLQTITLKSTITFPGGIAWDGQYLAIGDNAYSSKRTTVIDRVIVTGTSGTIVTKVPLNGTCEVLQFAIVGGTQVAAPDGCLNKLFVFAYPAGGAAIRTVANLQFPTAAAVSAAP
jgi:hypothetical protein